MPHIPFDVVAKVRRHRLKLLGTVASFAWLSAGVCGELSDAELFAKLSVKAAQGFPAAQYNLGMLYNNGTGTAADPRRAFELFQKAAAAGDPLASYKVGCYYAGQFPDVVATDPEKALAAKLIAAKGGYLRAQLDVANMYASRGDLQEATKWWAAAGEQGDEDSLTMLYMAHRYGRGAPQSDAKALEHLLIIQRMISPDRKIAAQETIDSLKKTVDPASVAQAEKIAAAWVPLITELTTRANLGIRAAQKLVE